jgi:hypothetical protein
MWVPHSVDRFANVDNRKTKRFNSLYWNPGTLGVDAFNSNWSSEVNWLVSPVSLASRTINHLHNDASNLTANMFPVNVPFANIELTFCPEAKIL